MVLLAIVFWGFVGFAVLGAISYLVDFIKGKPSKRDGAGDVIYRYMGYDKTYHVRIDITTEEAEETKE